MSRHLLRLLLRILRLDAGFRPSDDPSPPLAFAAIIGSALLSFTLSFDEIPVTFFLTGRDNTLPMYIYSTLRRGITPEINAVGTVIVVLSLGLIVLSVYLLHDSHKD